MTADKQSLTAKTFISYVSEGAMKLPLFAARRDRQAQSQQAAFEALVDGCWDALWRFAYHTTGDKDEAEDLLSETLLEGFRSFGQFRGGTPFVRWMYRVMTTTRIDMVRRSARHRAQSLDMGEEEDRTGTRDIPDEKADPERIILGPMLSEPVQKALAALSEEFRAVVVLADMEEMDYADISRILQIPVGTVRSRLHRARTSLRKSLSAYVESHW